MSPISEWEWLREREGRCPLCEKVAEGEPVRLCDVHYYGTDEERRDAYRV